MSGPGSRNDRPDAAGAAGNPGDPREFQRAVDRLEGAVDELVTMAKDQFSDRATAFVQDTADRLQREIEGRRHRQRSGGGSAGLASAPGGSIDSGASRGPGPRPEVRRSHDTRDNPYRTRKLYRDTRNQKITGVCAGIARYFGVEAWVVRCIAVTGVIFMAQIVVPAYFIATFVMPKTPDDGTTGSAPGERGAHRACGGRRRDKRGKDRRDVDEASEASNDSTPDHTSPAPELGARLSPRRSLRDVQWNLDQIELKLRRMETHVTSGQYELQRELKKIDT